MTSGVRNRHKKKGGSKSKADADADATDGAAAAVLNRLREDDDGHMRERRSGVSSYHIFYTFF